MGSSLGGMVACEVIKLRNIKALILVGSAVRKEEVNKLLRILRPLAQIAPMDWLRFSAGKIPNELCQMFAGADSDFIKGMCRALGDWKGLPSSGALVRRIHGKHDFIIPPPKKADLLLDGGHFIAMTHAEECAEFVRKAV